MNQWQETLVLIKPDAVRRGLISEVLGRYEAKGLRIEDLSMRRIDDGFADQHYAEHVAAGWYPELRAFVTSGPLVALVLAGEGAIDIVRAMNGPTDGAQAPAGTIRGDLCVSKRENVVHASDGPESAEREVALWFPGRTGRE